MLDTLAKVESQEWGKNTFAWARFGSCLGPCWTSNRGLRFIGLFLRPLRGILTRSFSGPFMGLRPRFLFVLLSFLQSYFLGLL